MHVGWSRIINWYRDIALAWDLTNKLSPIQAYGILHHNDFFMKIIDALLLYTGKIIIIKEKDFLILVKW